MPVAQKRIRVSTDGVTWYTLPGNTGELRNEAGEIVDTVFGQPFRSTQPGIIGWSITSNALYKGFAGYVAKLKKQGTATAFTDEACSLVSGKTYAITDTTKQIWDLATALVVKDDAVTVDDANIESVDYLFGQVTFVSGYTVNGAVTVSGKFYPTADLCGANSFTLTQQAEALDTTDMCEASSNNGFRTYQPGLRTVSLELGGFFNASHGNRATLLARDTTIIELNVDGGGKTVARGYFRMPNQSQSGGAGQIEEETVNYALNVPDFDKLENAFDWVHAVDTTLNNAVRILLDAWENETIIKVQYLWDGTNGVQGDAVVSEVSLSGGLESMNEFSVNLMCTGAPTDVP